MIHDKQEVPNERSSARASPRTGSEDHPGQKHHPPQENSVIIL